MARNDSIWDKIIKLGGMKKIEDFFQWFYSMIEKQNFKNWEFYFKDLKISKEVEKIGYLIAFESCCF